MMLNKFLSKRIHFSLFSSFLGLLLSHVLMMCTMVVEKFSFVTFFLFLIYAIGVMVTYCYRIIGLACTLVSFLLYFLLYYLMGYEGFMWKIGWGCSLFLGLMIFMLSIEEIEKFYYKKEKKKDKVIFDLKRSLHSLNEKRGIEKLSFEEETKELKKQYRSLQKKCEGALSFVEASRIEADKACKRNEALSTETLLQHRKIEAMKEKFALFKEEMQKLRSKYETLSISSKKQLCSLNETREELYQTQLLLKNVRISSSMNERERSQSIIFPPKNQQHLILQALKKDKENVKKAYDKIQEDMLSLKKIIEEEKDNEACEKKDNRMNKLKMEMLEYKKKLEMEKAKLIDIERDVFVTKKRMREEGVSVY